MFIKCLTKPNSLRWKGSSLLLLKSFTCQLGTKNGTPSFIPRLFATKTCPSSCTPRIRAVTRAPGKPSFNSSRLSNADLQSDSWIGEGKVYSVKHNMFWRKHGCKMFLTVSRLARQAHYGETMWTMPPIQKNQQQTIQEQLQLYLVVSS